MGTKANPGKFDCYAKAADDEPLFVLRAKDPTAKHLVCVWTSVQAGDAIGAIKAMLNALDASPANDERPLEYTSEKSMEASECARAMGEWEIARQIAAIEKRHGEERVNASS